MRNTLFAAITTGMLFIAVPASAATMHFTAKLNGASETPPNTTPGTGTASVDLDTSSDMVSWTLTYSGLTGPATGAHFHGPAAVGKQAGVAIPMTGALASPIKGSAKVTDAQAKDLKAGLWYVNLHTAANPGGEIRGQVTAAK
jgi:hypothetical protein